MTALLGVRTRLRPLRPDDYGYLFEMLSTPPALQQWRFRGGFPNHQQFVSALWNQVALQLLIEGKHTGRPLGLVQAYDRDLRNGHVRFSMIVDPAVQGQGWPLEAAVLSLDHLFRLWNLRKIYADVLEPFWAPIGSAVGWLFDEEACLLEHEFYDGSYHSLRILSVTKERWAAVGPRLVAALDRR